MQLADLELVGGLQEAVGLTVKLEATEADTVGLCEHVRVVCERVRVPEELGRVNVVSVWERVAVSVLGSEEDFVGEGEKESETDWLLEGEQVWEKDTVMVVEKVLTRVPVGVGVCVGVSVDVGVDWEHVNWEAVAVGDAECNDSEREERDQETVAVDHDGDTTVGLAEVGVWEQDRLSEPVCEALTVPAQDCVGEGVYEVGDMDKLSGVWLNETLGVGDVEELCGSVPVMLEVTDAVSVRW